MRSPWLAAALALAVVLLIGLAVYAVQRYSLWLRSQCEPRCGTLDDLVTSTLYLMIIIIVAAIAVYGPAAATASKPFIW